MRFFLLILKNLRRSPLRTALTAGAVIALVAIFSMIFNVLNFLDSLTEEKSKDVKVLISERYRMLSMFDRGHVDQIVGPGRPLNRQLHEVASFDNSKHNVWHFVIFTLDPEMKDKDQQFFAVACLPDKIATMTDGLEDFDPAWEELMRNPPRSRRPNIGMVMGAGRLAKLNKQVGDVFPAKAVAHRDSQRQPIEMDFEIIGAIPAENRWNDAAFMDYAYLDRVLKKKGNELDGKINYGLLQFDDQAAANAGGAQIENYLQDIKCETMSSAHSRFMEPLKNILWGIKFLLVPAILAVMTLILANTFSLTVRERLTEMAVLKVLGFRPWHIVVLVLGEAALVGVVAGLLGSGVTYVLVNHVAGGIQLTGFPAMHMPMKIFLWGPAIGAATAVVGGLWPALSARAVKAAHVFSNAT